MVQRSVLENWVNRLNEQDFRTLVLIPLFKALGYRNVDHYHGGARELGKDIVMWKEDDFRAREYYAVVAKAGKLTGSVSGSGSFAEIVVQVQQALGSTYREPSTFDEVRIDRCIVATNSPIKKEALEALNSALAETINSRRVSIFVYNNMIDYMLNHKIGPGSVGSMLELLSMTDPANKVRNITINTDGKKRQIKVNFSDSVPKEDLVGRYSLSFPSTEEGETFRRRYQDFIEKGVAVEIPRKFVTMFELPKAVVDLGATAELDTLLLGPNTSNVPLQFNMKCTSDEGDVVELQNINFVVTAVGTKEATIEHSSNQSVFFIQLRIVHSVQVDLSYRLRDDRHLYSVVEVNRFYEFLTALSKGGTLQVLDSKTKLQLLRSTIKAGLVDSLDPFLMDIYQKASEIQEMTNTILKFPENGLSKQDVTDIHELHEIVTTGGVTRIGGTFTLSFNSGEKLEEINETDGFQDINVQLSLDQVYKILGKVIDIGTVKYIIPRGQVRKVRDPSGPTKVIIDVDPDAPATSYVEKFRRGDNC